nr:hypothetical protein [uncultured Pedobacter sp.]
MGVVPGVNGQTWDKVNLSQANYSYLPVFTEEQQYDQYYRLPQLLTLAFV